MKAFLRLQQHRSTIIPLHSPTRPRNALTVSLSPKSGSAKLYSGDIFGNRGRDKKVLRLWIQLLLPSEVCRSLSFQLFPLLYSRRRWRQKSDGSWLADGHWRQPAVFFSPGRSQIRPRPQELWRGAMWRSGLIRHLSTHTHSLTHTQQPRHKETGASPQSL